MRETSLFGHLVRRGIGENHDDVKTDPDISIRLDSSCHWTARRLDKRVRSINLRRPSSLWAKEGAFHSFNQCKPEWVWWSSSLVMDVQPNVTPRYKCKSIYSFFFSNCLFCLLVIFLTYLLYSFWVLINTYTVTSPNVACCATAAWAGKPAMSHLPLKYDPVQLPDPTTCFHKNMAPILASSGSSYCSCNQILNVSESGHQ